MPIIAAARLSNALSVAKTTYQESLRSRLAETGTTPDRTSFKNFLLEALASNVVASSGTNKPTHTPTTTMLEEDPQQDLQSFAYISLRNLIESARHQYAESSQPHGEIPIRHSVDSVLNYLIESQSYASTMA